MSAIKICPRCGEQYDASISFCAKDGTHLVSAAQPGADLIGMVVADRYRIEAKLGEGGMGTVYMAEHVRMKRKSAIKIMRPALIGDVEALQRFTREAEHASQISHPNVASIYDFGETSDNMVYLAMEYIDGESLAAKLARELAIHPDIASDIIGQAADALQAAHDMGILHRDLKPDNIMLARRPDTTYIVKLVDFGIARSIEAGQRMTRTGFAVGTPEYMSPEQLSGDEIDARSDQYALALVAFATLTGKDAFPSETSKESLVARLTSRPQKLDEARRDVQWPAALQDIFDKALSPEPADRYPTVRDFANAMASAINLMSPSQTAAMYRRALEARLATVAMRTPHANIAVLSTPPAQPTGAIETSEDAFAMSPESMPSGNAAGASTTAQVAATTGAGGAATGTTAVVTKRKKIPDGVKWVLFGFASAFIGVVAWAFVLTRGESAATADSLALADSARVAGGVAAGDTLLDSVADSLARVAGVMLRNGAASGATMTEAEALQDSLAKVALAARNDSIAAAQRARRDSLARRAAAVERFPEAPIEAARAARIDWRERVVRKDDMRVVLLTPPAAAARAHAASEWKRTHVSAAAGVRYEKVDVFDQWSQWSRLISARRPVVVVAVFADRVPFEQFEPEKIVDVKRGDVQQVELLRDGTPVSLLNAERFPALVNDGAHRDARRLVPNAFAAVVPPDVFAPGTNGTFAKFELRVVDAANRGRESRIALSDAMVRRVYAEFEPYREALK